MEMLERMRFAREERNLDLTALGQRTRVPVHLLEAIECGRLDALPRGVYARAVIRAYASAVGIEPNRAVTELAPLLPPIEDPLDGIARVRGFSRPQSCAAARHSENDAGIVTPESACAPPGPSAALQAVHRMVGAARERLRIRTSWHPGWGTRPIAVEGLPDTRMLARRAGATLIDAVLLTAVNLVLVILTARTAATPVSGLLEFALPAMLMLWVLIAGLYFLLLGGVAGATVGSRLMHVAEAEHGRARLNGAAMCHRGWRAASREMSIVVDVLVPILLGRPSGDTPSGPRSQTPWEGRAAVR
jgi:hypothetical protein